MRQEISKCGPRWTFERLSSGAYGEEADWESRIRGVKLIANALNKQDMARATMTAVLMRLPEPGGELGIFNVDGMLAKAGFNPDEARDERGQWTRDGDANERRAIPTATQVFNLPMPD
jgi:hypothetical protein